MKKVLFLEDEEVLGKIYRKQLEAAGFEVKWTTSIQETEDLLQDFSADVVILDHGIHDEDRSGVDLLPVIKDRLPRSRLVMLSNYSLPSLQKEAREKGADEYFIKINTSPDQLITFLKRMDES